MDVKNFKSEMMDYSLVESISQMFLYPLVAVTKKEIICNNLFVDNQL